MAICGSTRSDSANQQLINIIAARYKQKLAVELYNGLAQLPHFNPDLDKEIAPEPVIDFRSRLKSADAVFICTPEYAMGVPGSLKNALDWVVSSMELSGKPVALVTASSLGEQAHASLIQTLLVIECKIPENCRLLIPFIKSKMKNAAIIDQETTAALDRLINAFISVIADKT